MDIIIQTMQKIKENQKNNKNNKNTKTKLNWADEKGYNLTSYHEYNTDNNEDDWIDFIQYNLGEEEEEEKQLNA